MNFKVNSSLLTMPAIPVAISLTTALTCNVFTTQRLFSEPPNTMKETKDCRFTLLSQVLSKFSLDLSVSHSLSVRFFCNAFLSALYLLTSDMVRFQDTCSSRTCPPNRDGVQRGCQSHFSFRSRLFGEITRYICTIRVRSIFQEPSI